MAEQTDTLKLLRRKYEYRIDELRCELAEVEQKLTMLKELEPDARDLAGAASLPPMQPKYVNGKISLINAILDVVNSSGTKGVTARDVVNRLIEGGYAATGKNFTTTVNIGLWRLANRDEKISSEKQGTSRIYLPKKA